MNESPSSTVALPEAERAEWIIRPAEVGDVPRIKELIDPNALKGAMLPKTLGELYESVRDFQVGVDGDRVIAVGALHVLWEDLAEIRSLAVDEEFQGRGAGKAVTRALLEEAERLRVGRVFALTYATRFFTSLGFRVLDKNLLPRKVWSDCIHCHKFPICDEVAVIYDFRPFPEGPVGPPPELPQVIDLQRLVPGLRFAPTTSESE
ncbi:MAG: Amino-acid acetyltransferase [bacterium]|nr:Amino-acid acetyltransferase [bacterium]